MRIEWVDNVPFAHIDVFNSNTSTLREIKSEVWPDLKRFVYMEGVDHLLCYTTNERFVKFLGGGEYIGHKVMDGIPRAFYVWDVVEENK